MLEQTTNEKQASKVNFILGIIGLIAISVVSRVIPHPWNFTALGAVSLFSGVWFSPKVGARQFRLLAFIVPLTGLLLGDAILGFHNTMVYTYFATAFAVILGGSLSKSASGFTWAGRSLVASLIFFLVTNFGVWAAGTLYPKTFAGLLQCYAMGIPFFGNQILGDFFYLAVLLATVAFLRKPVTSEIVAFPTVKN